MWTTIWLLEKGRLKIRARASLLLVRNGRKKTFVFQVSFPKCICICVLDVNNFSHNYNCICVLDVTHLGHKDTSICVLYDTHLSVKYCKDDLQLVHVALTMQCVHLNWCTVRLGDIWALEK